MAKDVHGEFRSDIEFLLLAAMPAIAPMGVCWLVGPLT
jgi:hypothetical protein